MTIPRNPLRELDQAGIAYANGEISKREYLRLIDQTYSADFGNLFRVPSLVFQAIGYRIKELFSRKPK